MDVTVFFFFFFLFFSCTRNPGTVSHMYVCIVFGRGKGTQKAWSHQGWAGFRQVCIDGGEEAGGWRGEKRE
jgi:hypothetical protein